MSDSKHSTILRRMTGRQAGDAAETPQTSSRAVRLALTKAANDTIGLVLTVSGMRDDVQPLDDVLAGLGTGLMLIALDRGGQLAGLVAIDAQLRAAMLEVQITGRLIAAQPEERSPTQTDRVMCEPVLARFLKNFAASAIGTEFEGWFDDVSLGQIIADNRAAGLVMTDHDYRVLKLGVDLGVAEREGQLILALPPARQNVIAEPAPTNAADWVTQFQEAVADAPGELDALLHRFRLPLAEADNLVVGQLLPLSGCTVNSVRLLSSDGTKIVQAKLGQLGGMRAVRVEPPPAPQMRDLSGAGEAGLPSMIGGERVTKGAVTDQGADGVAVTAQTALMDEVPDDAYAVAADGSSEDELLGEPGEAEAIPPQK